MIHNLTGLRFFLAIWVVLFHVHHEIDTEWLRAICNKGYWAVDVFFVLSGFIISHVYRQRFQNKEPGIYKKFIVKRFSRLFPVHWFSIIVIFILFHVFTLPTFGLGAPMADLPWHVLNIHAWGFVDHLSWNLVSWSISAEWLAYLALFPTLVYVAPRIPRKLFPIAVAATWIGFVIICDLYNRSSINVAAYGALRIIAEFMAGFWLASLKPASRRRAGIWFVPLAIILYLLGLLVDERFMEYGVLPMAVLLISFVEPSRPRADVLLSSRLAIYMGKVSYSIYMMQFFGLWLGLYVIDHHPLLENLFPAMVVIFTIGFAIATYHLVEQPCRNLINRKANV